MTTLFDIKAHKGDIGGSTYTPYKFNGKELDQETGYYYYGARYYDPGTALWFGTDPLAHKYPMNSPYIYCNGNPVKYVDPDGRDIWEINNNGETVSRTTNTDVDRFEFVNADGSKTGIQFKYGVVEDTRSQKVKDQSMDVYKIRGDENAKSLFEFFVEGTSNNGIEWSWFETGIEGDKGLNFISTSHQRGKDSSGLELFKNQLANGYSIRSHTHNHPSGNNNPSVDDISVYRYIYDFNKWNAKYNNIHRTSPQYRIFTDKLHIVPNNLYIK